MTLAFYMRKTINKHINSYRIIKAKGYKMKY